MNNMMEQPTGRTIHFSARLVIPKATMIELERARKDADAPEDAEVSLSVQSFSATTNNSISIHANPIYVTFTWSKNV